MNVTQRLLLYNTVILSIPLALGTAKLIHGIFQTTDGLNEAESERAQDVIPDLFERIANLREDILIYYSSEHTFGRAYRNHFGPAPFIVINKEFADSVDPAVLRAIYKHEISHIYFNDDFTTTLMATIAAAVSAYVIYRLQFVLPWWVTTLLLCLPTAIFFTTSYIFSCMNEKRADAFAFTHSTDEELKGARRYFQAPDEATEEMNQIIHTALPHLKISQAENESIDTHLSNKERVDVVENEMKKRNISIETLDLDPAYLTAKNAIKNFHLTLSLRLLKAALEKAGEDTSKIESALEDAKPIEKN